MAIYVFYISIKMIASNIQEILTNTEENHEIEEEVIKEVEKFKELDLKKIRIIKMSTYYSVFLKIDVDDEITMKEYLSLERKLKKHLKNKKHAIRFIDIEPM